MKQNILNDLFGSLKFHVDEQFDLENDEMTRRNKKFKRLYDQRVMSTINDVIEEQIQSQTKEKLKEIITKSKNSSKPQSKNTRTPELPRMTSLEAKERLPTIGELQKHSNNSQTFERLSQNQKGPSNLGTSKEIEPIPTKKTDSKRIVSKAIYDYGQKKLTGGSPLSSNVILKNLNSGGINRTFAPSNEYTTFNGISGDFGLNSKTTDFTGTDCESSAKGRKEKEEKARSPRGTMETSNETKNNQTSLLKGTTLKKIKIGRLKKIERKNSKKSFESFQGNQKTKETREGARSREVASPNSVSHYKLPRSHQDEEENSRKLKGRREIPGMKRDGIGAGAGWRSMDQQEKEQGIKLEKSMDILKRRLECQKSVMFNEEEKMKSELFFNEAIEGENTNKSQNEMDLDEIKMLRNTLKEIREDPYLRALSKENQEGEKAEEFSRKKKLLLQKQTRNLERVLESNMCEMRMKLSEMQKNIEMGFGDKKALLDQFIRKNKRKGPVFDYFIKNITKEKPKYLTKEEKKTLKGIFKYQEHKSVVRLLMMEEEKNNKNNNQIESMASMSTYRDRLKVPKSLLEID